MLNHKVKGSHHMGTKLSCNEIPNKSEAQIRNRSLYFSDFVPNQSKLFHFAELFHTKFAGSKPKSSNIYFALSSPIIKQINKKKSWYHH